MQPAAGRLTLATRRSSTAVLLGVTAVLAVSLTGCSTGADYQGMCKDKGTGNRLPDDQCADGNTAYRAGGHFWYFLPVGARAPMVGSALTGGSSLAPAGKSFVRGGVSATGGTISRGGFGGSFGFGG